MIVVVDVGVAFVIEDEEEDFPTTSEGRSSFAVVVVFFVSSKLPLPSFGPFSTPSPDAAFDVVVVGVVGVAIAVTLSVAFCLPSSERRFPTTASGEEGAPSFFGSPRGRSSPPLSFVIVVVVVVVVEGVVIAVVEDEEGTLYYTRE